MKLISSAMVQKLVRAACRARTHSYSPYSRYRVGASVLAQSGKIYLGCNVENASLGLSCCAERSAIFNAVSNGEKKFLALAVAGKHASPCGACRQVLLEFGPSLEVIAVHLDFRERPCNVQRYRVRELLPKAFTDFQSEKE